MILWSFMVIWPRVSRKGDERERGVEKITSFMAMISVTQQNIRLCPNTLNERYFKSMKADCKVTQI